MQQIRKYSNNMQCFLLQKVYTNGRDTKHSKLRKIQIMGNVLSHTKVYKQLIISRVNCKKIIKYRFIAIKKRENYYIVK